MGCGLVRESAFLHPPFDLNRRACMAPRRNFQLMVSMHRLQSAAAALELDEREHPFREVREPAG